MQQKYWKYLQSWRNPSFLSSFNYKITEKNCKRGEIHQRKKKDPSCGWGIAKVGPFLPLFFFFSFPLTTLLHPIKYIAFSNNYSFTGSLLVGHGIAVQVHGGGGGGGGGFLIPLRALESFLTFCLFLFSSKQKPFFFMCFHPTRLTWLQTSIK